MIFDDGLKLLVQFYDNHGALLQVSLHSGVPQTKLREWLDGGKLSTKHRQMLGDCIPKQQEAHSQGVNHE